MSLTYPLVPDPPLPLPPDVLRVESARRGQADHLVRAPEGLTLYVSAPDSAAPTGPGCGDGGGVLGRAESLRDWGHRVGQALLAHEWATARPSCGVVVDLAAFTTDTGSDRSTPSDGRHQAECHGSWLPARFVALGLLDALGGPGTDLARRTHLTGVRLHPEVEAVLRRAVVEGRAVALARELVDARGNELTPARFAGRATAVAESCGLRVRRWSAADLATAAFGGILAVGAGSPNPPVLLELSYEPPVGPGSAGPPVALVGKGITFDSGGLSLKSPAAMIGMHTDKAGAVAVLAVMSALDDLDVAVPVRGYLALAENLPGPGATRPGDVVTTRNGSRVEVVDTDFEGRVLLADALSLACSPDDGRPAPSAVIDVATLTYQAVTALGPQIGAVVSRNRNLGTRLLDAAARAGEPLWPLPWAPRYHDQIRSRARGASLRNHPGTDTGRALTAALFLGEFVPEDIAWAHLDIAGPTVVGVGADQHATGYGVLTLIELLMHWTPTSPLNTGEQP